MEQYGESLVVEETRSSKEEFAENFMDLQILGLINNLISKLEKFSRRDSQKEISSLYHISESIRTQLCRGLEVATSRETSGKEIIFSNFLPFSRNSCLCCLTSRESHFETFSKMLGCVKSPEESNVLAKIHRQLDQACHSLKPLLTNLRVELIRVHYLIKQRTSASQLRPDNSSVGFCELKSDRDESVQLMETFEDLEVPEVLELLELCTVLLDTVHIESSSSLLNQTFQKCREQMKADLKNTELCRTHVKVSCSWEEPDGQFLVQQEPTERSGPSCYVPVKWIDQRSPSSANDSAERSGSSVRADSGRSESSVRADSERGFLDILPFEMWQRILSYVTDDDACVYSLLQASRKFWDFLPKATKLMIENSEYWKNALIKRGVDVQESCCRKGRSWFGYYHEHVQSMACFGCFARLCRRNTAAKEEEKSHHYSGRIRKEASMVARGYVYMNSRIVTLPEAVLNVQFCNWEIGKPPAQQKNFDNLVVTLLGPAGTPYCGGRFQLWVHFPPSYPLQPPRLQLLTKIISPYFTEHGDFHFSYNKVLGGGTDATRKTHLDYYSVCFEIGHIVNIVIGCLSLSPDIGEKEDGVWSSKFAVVNHKVEELRRENKELFETIARKQTQKYAMSNWIGPSPKTPNLSNEDTLF